MSRTEDGIYVPAGILPVSDGGYLIQHRNGREGMGRDRDTDAENSHRYRFDKSLFVKSRTSF